MPCSSVRCWLVAVLELSDALVGALELVFEADDVGCGRERHVLVEELAHTSSQGELGAAVATLATG